MCDLIHEIERKTSCLTERLERTVKSFMSEDRFAYRLVAGALAASFMPALIAKDILDAGSWNPRDITETVCDGYLKLANWIIFGSTDWRECRGLNYISEIKE